ncbi:Uncharacterized [Syntrophomonas zehnderi OL-4]|uniref:Uncharacterized n=1 Tax=Syntrophomonas zehnderi OL-4 TaxID=690567 RepID=A0A0E4GC91_9FIRM|nr:Uncharacterized [Syntrophomonas zehnderi OL-4]
MTWCRRRQPFFRQNKQYCASYSPDEYRQCKFYNAFYDPGGRGKIFRQDKSYCMSYGNPYYGRQFWY